MIVGLGNLGCTGLGCAGCGGKCHTGLKGFGSIYSDTQALYDAQTKAENARTSGDAAQQAYWNQQAASISTQIQSVYTANPAPTQAQQTQTQQVLNAILTVAPTCPTGYMWDGIAGLRGLAGCVKTAATLAAEAAALKAQQDAATKQAAIVAARTCPTGYQWDGVDGLGFLNGCIPIPSAVVTPPVGQPVTHVVDTVPVVPVTTNSLTNIVDTKLLGIPVWALGIAGVAAYFAFGGNK